MTFDTDDAGGTWRLYANGKQAWTQVVHAPGVKPFAQNYFQVGLGKAMQADTLHSFCGKIDELMIYNRAIDAETVAQLTRDGGSALHLPLDDAPGASAFQDTSVAARQLSCGAKGCPTSGIAGRLSQAALFDGAGQKSLVLGNSSINKMTNNFSAAAWVKPTDVSGRKRIISTATAISGDGWGFGLNNSDLILSTYGKKDYLLSSAITGGANLQAGRWHHVAAVMDASNAVSFYVDGQLKGKVSGTAPGAADTNDFLMVGAAGSTTAPAEVFNGLIDDLWVYGTALTASQIADLYKNAPVLHLQFEEANGKTSFQDNARYGSTGSCAGNGCPTVGEAVRGQVGLAAEFDGVDDSVTVKYDATLNTTTFSAGGWIWPATMPTTTPPAWHEIITKRVVSTSTNENYRLAVNEAMQVMVERRCGASVSTVTSATPVMADHWNHVIGTYDGQTLRLYVNGSESGSLASTGQCSDTGSVDYRRRRLGAALCRPPRRSRRLQRCASRARHFRPVQLPGWLGRGPAEPDDRGRQRSAHGLGRDHRQPLPGELAGRGGA